MEAAKEQKASVSPEAHVLSVKSVFNPSIRRCKRSPPPSLIGGTSLPSASSPKMPGLAGGAGLGCSPPSPCPGGSRSIPVPQAHHVGMTQCSFSCSSASLSCNLKLTFFFFHDSIHKRIVLKLLVWKVSWVDGGPRAVALERENWCGLCWGDFSSPSSNSALQFIRHKLKRIVFLLLLHLNWEKQVSIAAEATSPTMQW